MTPVVPIAFTIAGVGLILGVAAGAVALARANDLDDRCAVPGPDACTQDEIDEANLIAHVSTAGLVTSGVATAVGVVALALWWPDDPAQAPVARGLGLRLEALLP
jgi:hypothetical protein